MKNTPSPIETAVPVFEASWSIKLATVSPEVICVFPYTNVSSTTKFSPSVMNVTSLLSPDSRYLTNNVRSVISAESSGNAKLSTLTLFPLSCPLNILPFKFSTYKDTGTPKWSEFNLSE